MGCSPSARLNNDAGDGPGTGAHHFISFEGYTALNPRNIGFDGYKGGVQGHLVHALRAKL
jgi:hypothetical protein